MFDSESSEPVEPLSEQPKQSTWLERVRQLLGLSGRQERGRQLEQLNNQIATNPKAFAAYVHRGELQLKDGDYVAAKNDFEQALDSHRGIAKNGAIGVDCPDYARSRRAWITKSHELFRSMSMMWRCLHVRHSKNND